MRQVAGLKLGLRLDELKTMPLEELDALIMAHAELMKPPEKTGTMYKVKRPCLT